MRTIDQVLMAVSLAFSLLAIPTFIGSSDLPRPVLQEFEPMPEISKSEANCDAARRLYSYTIVPSNPFDTRGRYLLFPKVSGEMLLSQSAPQ